MKRVFLALAVALGLAAGPAFAGASVESMLAQVDKALAGKPQLSYHDLSKVKKLRGDAERLHKKGEDTKAGRALSEALRILEIEPGT